MRTKTQMLAGVSQRSVNSPVKPSVEFQEWSVVRVKVIKVSWG